MNYKIKNTLIPRGWFEDKILATLTLYEAGKDISESPLIEATLGVKQNKTRSGHYLDTLNP